MTDPIQKNALTASIADGVLRLKGDFTVWTLHDLPAGADETSGIDLSEVYHLDTAGAWYLLGRESAGARIEGLSGGQAGFVDMVRNARPEPDPEAPALKSWRALLERTGRRVVEALGYARELAEYQGRFLAAVGRAIRHPRDFRFTSLVYHCQETGMRAVPIVALMSFLIGVVLAFQGSMQLQRFGAEIFVIDLIAVSVLRELGILLTAIIVAGRTASALTASIGSMKMNEEVDAMRTLGLDPDMVLILPRVLALIITLPILGLISNLFGLFGGALMSWIELGISPSMFKYRLLADISVDHVIVGLSKAPVFAMIIGVIGCHAGMKVGKDAESLGAQTSTAVVAAIFAVIVADALFSIFFAEIGL
ncbi:phospholipid/cholesterol/gamma-HCH transport system permease protein [Paracoccus halophilus]|uniref:ABC transporter permease n=1 Tax=Paracoccus halophilus TaxID=376733 RepID=A0A099F5V7_9RHOB|nr:ABC transporter permease [Paracoccus halophilus]KGJ05596.1 ABC transporter permease [Paracoccus halophilus]SFA47277.1 phospholipid/cholesterol/gamma-HCH transport system permease protein [Paracoccus halophilus]